MEIFLATFVTSCVILKDKVWDRSLERPMGECSTHCGAGYLEKAKLSEPYLLRLKVSNRRGSHQALNIDTEK